LKQHGFIHDAGMDEHCVFLTCIILDVGNVLSLSCASTTSARLRALAGMAPGASGFIETLSATQVMLGGRQ
jgi:hypothetical protein